MAAIDYFGDTIRVTAAGTITGVIEVKALRIWSLNSTSALIADQSGSGGHEVLNFAIPDVDNVRITNVHFKGRYTELSFNTVTACTAWIDKA